MVYVDVGVYLSHSPARTPGSVRPEACTRHFILIYCRGIDLWATKAKESQGHMYRAVGSLYTQVSRRENT
jgi:hypothetical protein